MMRSTAPGSQILRSPDLFRPTDIFRRYADTRSRRLWRSMFDLRFGAPAEAVKVQINDRSGIKGKHLRNDQSTDDRDTEGLEIVIGWIKLS